MIECFFKHLAALQPGEEVLLGSIAEQTKLAPQVISAVLLGAEDKGLLTCYAPDKADCRWVVNGNLGAWIEQQQQKVAVRVTRRRQILSYIQRKKSVTIAELVGYGHSYHTVANYFKELRRAGRLELVGKGIYSYRPEEGKK